MRLHNGKVKGASICAPAENRRLLIEELAGGMDGFIREVYNRTDGRWLDSTPGHFQLQALPVIDVLFPNARYVMITRNVYESVRANIANWPASQTDITETAKRWLTCRESWRSFAASTAPERILELNFAALHSEAERLAPKFSKLLNVPEERAARMMASTKQFMAANRGAHQKNMDVELSDLDRDWILEIVGEEAELETAA